MENGNINNFKIQKTPSGVKIRKLRSPYENELIKENQELSKEVKLDPKTKLYNSEELKVFLQNSMKEHSEASLLFVDVDDFKDVNDKYNHITGDEVLNVLSKRLKTSFEGPVCRFGGDEFVVLLPNLSDKKIAFRRAEEFRKMMDEQPIVIGNNQIKQTVSIGIASKSGLNNVDEWITKADQAMYKAKESGKNQTVMAE